MAPSAPANVEHINSSRHHTLNKCFFDREDFNFMELRALGAIGFSACSFNCNN